MRSIRRRFTTRGLMAIVAVSALTTMFGASTSLDQYSCHLCHNRVGVRSMKILGLPIWWSERAATRFPFPMEHAHRWHRYSANSTGLIGGRARYCSRNVFADGSVAPDGSQ
jgi:hypothetical protein